MPTPSKKREAAQKRLGERKPADPPRSLSSRFAVAGTRSGTPSYDVLIQARVGESLAADLAAYGNAHKLSASDTIRNLLEAGLEKEKNQK